MFLNPVILSVLAMIILSLLRLNVILALLVAAIVGGISANIPISEVMGTLVEGMGKNAETALSYLLLGALAVAINHTGLPTLLSKKIAHWMKGRGKMLVLLLAVVACFSQNLIPVHIAFIPILIPPLLGVMNNLKIDRRAVASALTFGLQAPYVMIPAGFGLIFHNIIKDEMKANGMEIATDMVWKALFIPGLGMILGLLVAIFFTYKKTRIYDEEKTRKSIEQERLDTSFNIKHVLALLAAMVALGMQLITESLPLGALTGLGILLLFKVIPWKKMDHMMTQGVHMMGFIAFVMLVASGYGAVIRETGAVDTLIQSASSMMGGNKFIAAFIMLLIGLIITMGIGTSFGTIPILATIYVPLCAALGFSPMATIVLLGTAGALGDAGSPASDSTLGPTAGLNMDEQHDHIWDTCVPTFIHFNIPLIIFGTIAALIF